MPCPAQAVIKDAMSPEQLVLLKKYQAGNALNIVTSLPPSQVTTTGNQVALGETLKQVVKFVQQGKIADARNKILDAMERTDGCTLRGAPDDGKNGFKRDTITDCVAQLATYQALQDALAALDTL